MVASEIEIPHKMSVQDRIRALQARSEAASTNQPAPPPRPPPVRARRVSATGESTVSRENTGGRSNQQSPGFNPIGLKKSEMRLGGGRLGEGRSVECRLSKDLTNTSNEESLISSRTMSRKGEPEQETAPAREVRADFVATSSRTYGKERDSVRELREMRERERLEQRRDVEKKPSNVAPPLRLPTRGGPPSREPVSSRGGPPSREPMSSRELLSHRSNPASNRELLSHRSNPPNRDPHPSRGGLPTRELVAHRTAPPAREPVRGPPSRMPIPSESRERDVPRNLPAPALSSGRKAFEPRGPSERRFESSERRGVKRSAFDLDLENELKKPLSSGPETLLIQATMMTELNDHLRDIDEWCASLCLSLPQWILQVKPFALNAERDPVFAFLEPMRARVEDTAPEGTLIREMSPNSRPAPEPTPPSSVPGSSSLRPMKRVPTARQAVQGIDIKRDRPQVTISYDKLRTMPEQERKTQIATLEKMFLHFKKDY